jgi:Zn-dependent M28 family amino/carboxypeptidase
VLGKQPPPLPAKPAIVDGVSVDQAARIALKPAAVDVVQRMPDGTVVRLETEVEQPQRSQTWNAVGLLRGTNRTGQAILISAHLDHLGRRPAAAGQSDGIYNGADDDASGTAVVMALAEELAKRGRLERTLVFAAFGSEEAGGMGSRYFTERPPVPLAALVANVQFEMLGRPDPAVAPKTLWLTGFDRSNLGVALANRGAKLVADPHPSQNFFQRSDNYALARRGIVAHTVSSFGLHREYHTPADESSLVDWVHMEEAVASLIGPLKWLANSSFVPEWRPGGKP